MKSVPRGNAIWNANGGVVSVLLTHLCFELGRFQKTYTQVISIFPWWGHFPHKYSIAPSGKTNDQIKKVRGAKWRGPDLLYHHAKYGGHRASLAGYRRKSVMFFVCFRMMKKETGNATKRYNFQNSYTCIALRKVSSCATIFKFFYRPPEQLL